MKKVLTVFAVVALAIVVASPAMAYRCMQGPQQDRGFRGPFNCGLAEKAEGVGLAAEQMEKINALREAHLKEIKPIKDQLHSKRGDLRIEWMAKNPDKEKILGLQKEVETLRGQLAEKATTHRLAMREILTPEQLSKVRLPRSMGRQMACGMAGTECMSDRAGMGCMRGDRAGMGRMKGMAGMRCMCDGPGMRGDQPPCWGMR